MAETEKDPEFEAELRVPLTDAEVKAFAEGRWSDPHDKTYKITEVVMAPATRLAIEVVKLRAVLHAAKLAPIYLDQFQGHVSVREGFEDLSAAVVAYDG